MVEQRPVLGRMLQVHDDLLEFEILLDEGKLDFLRKWAPVI